MRLSLRARGGRVEYAVMVKAASAALLAQVRWNDIRWRVPTDEGEVGARFVGLAPRVSALLSNAYALTAAAVAYAREPGVYRFDAAVPWVAAQTAWADRRAEVTRGSPAQQHPAPTNPAANTNNSGSTGGRGSGGATRGGRPRRPNPCGVLRLAPGARHVVSDIVRVFTNPNPRHPAYFDYQVVRAVVASLQLGGGSEPTPATSANLTQTRWGQDVDQATGMRNPMTIGNRGIRWVTSSRGSSVGAGDKTDSTTTGRATSSPSALTQTDTTNDFSKST